MSEDKKGLTGEEYFIWRLGRWEKESQLESKKELHQKLKNCLNSLSRREKGYELEEISDTMQSRKKYPNAKASDNLTKEQILEKLHKKPEAAVTNYKMALYLPLDGRYYVDTENNRLVFMCNHFKAGRLPRPLCYSGTFEPIYLDGFEFYDSGDLYLMSEEVLDLLEEKRKSAKPVDCDGNVASDDIAAPPNYNVGPSDMKSDWGGTPR